MRLLAIMALMLPLALHAADMRYRCTDPADIPRDADGKIIRSPAVRAAFAREHPCPATGKPTVSCAGWAIDHVIPLAVCGADRVENMQWLPVAIKSCAAKSGLPCKDRWERRVYARPAP